MSVVYTLKNRGKNYSRHYCEPGCREWVRFEINGQFVREDIDILFDIMGMYEFGSFREAGGKFATCHFKIHGKNLFLIRDIRFDI